MKNTPVPQPFPFAEWLGQLRDAGARLVTTGQVVTVHGRPMTDIDRHMIARHRHALHLAANHTHPDWWAYACGRTDHPLDPDQIPQTDDGFACATCGQPAAHLDPGLLPWCDRHHRPDLEQESGHAA